MKIEKIDNKKRGSALLMALLIITSIVIIAMGGSTLALTGVRMAGVQSQSVRSYYASEAGIEELLYRVRKDLSIDLSPAIGTIVINKTTFTDSETDYEVKLSAKRPFNEENIFTSLGFYLNTRRSVDVSF